MHEYFFFSEDMNFDDRNNELQELCQREGLLAPSEAQVNEQEKELLKDIQESYNVKEFYEKYKEHNWSEDWDSLEMSDDELTVRNYKSFFSGIK